MCVCVSDPGGDRVLRRKHADEHRSDTRRQDLSHLRGASEADGSVAEGERGRHLQHDGVEGAERLRHSQRLVGSPLGFVRLVRSDQHVWISW